MLVYIGYFQYSLLPSLEGAKEYYHKKATFILSKIFAVYFHIQ